MRGARGPCGEYGAIGVVELKQDAKQVFEFMRRVEEQPSWNPGVKLSQIVNRVANTIHVKQVGHQLTAHCSSAELTQQKLRRQKAHSATISQVLSEGVLVVLLHLQLCS